MIMHLSSLLVLSLFVVTSCLGKNHAQWDLFDLTMAAIIFNFAILVVLGYHNNDKLN
jgi:hypothetical protein